MSQRWAGVYEIHSMLVVLCGELPLVANRS